MSLSQGNPKHPELKDESHDHRIDENGEYYDPDTMIIGGSLTNIKSYHHDPHDGTMAYHFHSVWDTQKRTNRYFYHFGSAEHKDEAPGHIDYWLNQYPVKPKSGFTPRAAGVAEAHLSNHDYHKLEEHSPPASSPLPPAYAPASPKLSESRHSYFSRNPPPSAPHAEEKQEEYCCRFSCTIS